MKGPLQEFVKLTRDKDPDDAFFKQQCELLEGQANHMLRESLKQATSTVVNIEFGIKDVKGVLAEIHNKNRTHTRDALPSQRWP